MPSRRNIAKLKRLRKWLPAVLMAARHAGTITPMVIGAAGLLSAVAAAALRGFGESLGLTVLAALFLFVAPLGAAAALYLHVTARKPYESCG
jgi:hypothetical protein